MNQTQAAAVRPVAPREPTFLEKLMSPSVDRAIAVVAVLPIVWAGYCRYHRFGFNLPVAYYFIATPCWS